ncbi:ribosome recycling factor [bacterium]|nr:ribosome recycling factor [bacterium]
MDPSIRRNAEDKMQKTRESLVRELAAIRTGRATPAILDRITVEAYGSMMPINQLATIGMPDARMLAIQPFDKKNITAIEKAIQKSDLGINPVNDGMTIRLVFPPLNEERRKDLAKQAKKLTEEAKVSLRNIRRDAIDTLKKLKDAPEDEVKRAQDDIQKLLDKNIDELGKVYAAKEKEIMEI